MYHLCLCFTISQCLRLIESYSCFQAAKQEGTKEAAEEKEEEEEDIEAIIAEEFAVRYSAVHATSSTCTSCLVISAVKQVFVVFFAVFVNIICQIKALN